jgi:hypothetical protein
MLKAIMYGFSWIFFVGVRIVSYFRGFFTLSGLCSPMYRGSVLSNRSKFEWVAIVKFAEYKVYKW